MLRVFFDVSNVAECDPKSSANANPQLVEQTPAFRAASTQRLRVLAGELGGSPASLPSAEFLNLAYSSTVPLI